MKTKLTIAVLLAATTLGTSAYARGGDQDRGGRDHRYDQRQHERHDQWRHDNRRDHWRYDHRPPPHAYNYGYNYEYRPAPRYYEQPAVYLPLPPLPPPPHEVLRDILRGHR